MKANNASASTETSEHPATTQNAGAKSESGVPSTRNLHIFDDCAVAPIPTNCSQDLENQTLEKSTSKIAGAHSICPSECANDVMEPTFKSKERQEYNKMCDIEIKVSKTDGRGRLLEILEDSEVPMPLQFVEDNSQAIKIPETDRPGRLLEILEDSEAPMPLQSVEDNSQQSKYGSCKVPQARVGLLHTNNQIAPQTHCIERSFPSSPDSNKGLAVARRVSDEPIYEATEYHPRDKAPIHRGRCRVYTVVSLFLVIILVALALGIVYTIKNNEEEVDHATEVRTHERPTDKPLSMLEIAIQENVLQDNVGFSSMNKADPRWSAMDWILHKDKMQLGLSDLNLFQRYILALFAFQLDSPGWTSCGGNYLSAEVQCTLNTNDTDTEESHTRWLSNTHECHWYGVSCRYGNVTSLTLTDNYLVGKIPPEISQLDGLEILALDNNCIYGNIPSQIGLMTNLRMILINNNYFTGEITPEIRHLKKLEILRAGSNAFSGFFPNELLELKHLREIGLESNYLSGTIPENIGQPKSLEAVHLYHNGNMTGTLPDSLYTITNLKELLFFENHFEGSIKSEIGNLKELIDFCIHSNQFTGTIPSELGNCENLEIFQFHDNQMTGTIPNEICALVEKNLDSENPNKMMLKADCPLDNGVNPPFIQCDCCQSCCDHSSGVCTNWGA